MVVEILYWFDFGIGGVFVEYDVGLVDWDIVMCVGLVVDEVGG